MDPTGGASDATMETAEGQEHLTLLKTRGGSAPVDTEGSTKDMTLHTKKRKPTYYHRKDEITSLQEQIKELQDQVARYYGNPTPRELELRKSIHLTARLRADIEHNIFRFAGTQSMLSSYQRNVGVEAPLPMNTYIHLPIDQDKRNRVLLDMRNHKLRMAYRFMQERTEQLDLSRKHYSIETFDYPNGDIAHISFNVTVFDPQHTLREVYEEFLFFVSNQEMTASEKLGVLTVRESDEVEDAKFCHSRFLATLPEGLEVEWNAAIFSGMYARTPNSPAYAIGTTDFVDRDDLYPFRPSFCGRKDITAAFMMNEVSTPAGPAIAMSRWSFVRFRQPEQQVPEYVKEQVRANMMDWCDLITHATAERLSARKWSHPKN